LFVQEQAAEGWPLARLRGIDTMKETTNPLLEPGNELFAKLNVLYGLLFHLESQLNNFRKSLMHQLEKSRFDLSVIAAGSALVIRDLTEWPEDNWACYYPTGSFTTRGEEYLQVTDILLSRESAWAVSQAYEAFETFLKDITAAYLYNHPDRADEDALKKNVSTLKKSGLKPSDIEYWRKFVRLTYRSGAKTLEYLRKLAPEIDKAEQHNNRAIDMSTWFEVVSKVRHATTHADLLIKSTRTSTFSKTADSLLKQYFPGNLIDVGYKLELNREAAKMAFNFFAEYAFLVFKCLSMKQGYDWQELLKRSKKSG
jgi:hypothetical protein